MAQDILEGRPGTGQGRQQGTGQETGQGRDAVGQISRGYVPRLGGCVPKWDAVSALKYALNQTIVNNPVVGL